MGTHYELVLQELRSRIVGNHWAPGERLMEVPIAQELGVSRTPVRLALATLAQEGLVLYAPQRGFTVRPFTPAQILDAVAVRGRLESLAAETLAQNGATATVLAALNTNLARTAALLDAAFGEAEEAAWPELNAAFHRQIAEAAGNETISRFLAELEAVPLVATGSFLRPSTAAARRAVVESSLFMHRLIVEAIAQRNAPRAGLLMAEHVHQGRQNLAARLAEPGQTAPLRRLVAG